MRIIEINDPAYPALLKQILEPPQALRCKGAWGDDICGNCLAVVGSRQMTTYGRQVTEMLIGPIAAAGVTIVSGFMYGVDAQAHRAALSAGGRTIAVMPCGIDIVHPEHQEDLYCEIIERGGAIISELEDDYPPMLWTYPKRNRIVAGLSKATLVIEAALGSGSLITAQFARDFNRKLFAVPGPVTSSVSQGTLQLLKQGASIAASAEDILEFYGLTGGKAKTQLSASACLNDFETEIIEKLLREPRDIDSLSRALSVPVARLGVAISLMQLRGLISQEANKYYVNFAGDNHP
jgi:DNA processing protein